jgi:lipid-A-disaccharide synthase
MSCVYVIAAERSGDDLGAGLIQQLRRLRPELEIYGTGGAQMAALGVTSEVDISPLSVLGLLEGLKAYPVARKLVKQTTKLVMDKNPDGVVLIDSWGFMIRMAWALRKAGYTGKLIKYVAPQVWAMREGRSKTLAIAVDHLLTIHDFDAPYFERHGLSVTHVGNPVFDLDYSAGDGEALKARLGISPQAKTVAVLFGSRRSEIERLAAPFAQCLELIKTEDPDIQFISPVANSIADHVRQAAKSDNRLGVVKLLPENEKMNVFSAADVALACSGTVTSQLASAGVPTIVAYRLSGLTYAIAKHLFKPSFISLVNISANAPLMPEFVQHDCNGAALSQAVLDVISSPERRAEISQSLKSQAVRMKGEGGPASLRAATAVLDILG